MKLTDDSIARLSLGDKTERFFRDSKDTGFAIRLRRAADGKIKRTFLVFYETTGDGKRKRKKSFIGDHPTFGAEQARKEARAMLQAHAVGDDPRAERREKKSAPTLAEFIIGYLESYHFTELSESSQIDYKGRLKRSIKPAFGDMRVKNITRQDISAWHKRGHTKPYDANRSLA